MCLVRNTKNVLYHRLLYRSFYGYKSEPGMFLKIYFYSPIALTKATSLLQVNYSKLTDFLKGHTSYIPLIVSDRQNFGTKFSTIRSSHSVYSSIFHGLQITWDEPDSFRQDKI